MIKWDKEGVLNYLLIIRLIMPKESYDNGSYLWSDSRRRIEIERRLRNYFKWRSFELIKFEKYYQRYGHS